MDAFQGDHDVIPPNSLDSLGDTTLGVNTMLDVRDDPPAAATTDPVPSEQSTPAVARPREAGRMDTSDNLNCEEQNRNVAQENVAQENVAEVAGRGGHRGIRVRSPRQRRQEARQRAEVERQRRRDEQYEERRQFRQQLLRSLDRLIDKL